MKYKRLSKEEKLKISVISRDTPLETINARKNAINQIIVDWVLEAGTVKNTWFAIFTQYGKSRVNKLLFDQYTRTNFFTSKILAIYPEIRIKNDADLLNPENVTNIVINSAQKITEHQNLILIDELQYALNPETLRSGVLDMPCDNLCGNAAFLDKDQIKILESKGVKYCFELSEEDGLELGLMPAFTSINISVELSNKEKIQYYHIQKQYKECIDFIYPVYGNKSQGSMFSLLKSKSMRETCVSSLNKLGNLSITEKQLFGKVLQYIKLVQQRMSLLENAEDKYITTIQIVKKHAEEKGIIFVDTIESAYKLQKIIPSSVVYSSKTKEIPLQEFREGKHSVLIVIGKADVGFISSELSYSINLSYIDKPLKTRQRAGRIKTINGKEIHREVTNYYLYVPNFIIYGEEVESQDFVWLKKAQEGSLFIEYLQKNEVFTSNS